VAAEEDDHPRRGRLGAEGAHDAAGLGALLLGEVIERGLHPGPLRHGTTRGPAAARWPAALR